MERTKINEAGHNGAANAPESDREDARLIGEVIAEIVTDLGEAQAIMPGNLVWIAPASPSGSGWPGFPRGRGRNALGFDVRLIGGGVHAAVWPDVARSGKSVSESGTRFFFAMAKRMGRLHSGTKFDRCQLWTVVAGIFALDATVA